MQCKHWSILGCAIKGNALGMEEKKVWHDVNKELPKNNRHVLVYVIMKYSVGKKDYISKHISEGFYEDKDYDTGESEWYDWDGDNFKLENMEVIAWKVLPEKPDWLDNK